MNIFLTVSAAPATSQLFGGPVQVCCSQSNLYQLETDWISTTWCSGQCSVLNALRPRFGSYNGRISWTGHSWEAGWSRHEWDSGLITHWTSDMAFKKNNQSWKWWLRKKNFWYRFRRPVISLSHLRAFCLFLPFYCGRKYAVILRCSITCRSTALNDVRLINAFSLELLLVLVLLSCYFNNILHCGFFSVMWYQ